jgi:hypothetical protein
VGEENSVSEMLPAPALWVSAAEARCRGEGEGYCKEVEYY